MSGPTLEKIGIGDVSFGERVRLVGPSLWLRAVKLRHLPQWTEARQAAARVYDVALAGVRDVETPVVATGRTHVYHLYVIQHPHRNALAAHLRANGVQTGINYPVALPFLEAYKRLGHRPEQFPHARRNQGRILSLPLFAEITKEQQATVIDLIAGFRADVQLEKRDGR